MNEIGLLDKILLVAFGVVVGLAVAFVAIFTDLKRLRAGKNKQLLSDRILANHVDFDRRKQKSG